MKYQFLHPFLRTCCADTILRAIEVLTYRNVTYESASSKSLDFNTADKMNNPLVNVLKQVDKFLLSLPSSFPHNHIEDYLLFEDYLLSDTFIYN